MSGTDFAAFYSAVVNIMLQAWNLLQSLKIAGIGLGSWSIGFFLLSVVINIFFKVTTGSAAGLVSAGSSARDAYYEREARRIGNSLFSGSGGGSNLPAVRSSSTSIRR